MTGNAGQAVIFKSVLLENLNRQKVGAFGKKASGEGEAHCQDQAPLSGLRWGAGTGAHAPCRRATLQQGQPLRGGHAAGVGGLGPLLARPPLLSHSFKICWTCSRCSFFFFLNL